MQTVPTLARPSTLPPFEHETRQQRVVFGAGTFATVADEAEKLGFRRPLIVATPGRAGFAHAVREGMPSASIYAEAKMHAPEAVVAAADAAAEAADADGLVSCGGGSALGIAKALAHQRRLRILAVATTYSGSEATARWSVTRDGAKEGGVDPIVLPVTVIYDPELTVSLPRETSAPSGMNAMAHAVAALYDAGTSPINQVLAVDALSRMGRALPSIEDDPENLVARGEALVASYLCGTVMPPSLGIHHRCAHVLGGTFGLPHAEVHTVLLPHTTAYNATEGAKADALIANAVGGAVHPGDALFALMRRLSTPTSLEGLGLDRSDLDEAARLVARSLLSGPRATDETAIRAMLARAFEGHPPVKQSLSKTSERRGEPA